MLPKPLVKSFGKGFRLVFFFCQPVTVNCQPFVHLSFLVSFLVPFTFYLVPFACFFYPIRVTLLIMAGVTIFFSWLAMDWAFSLLITIIASDAVSRVMVERSNSTARST